MVSEYNNKTKHSAFLGPMRKTNNTIFNSYYQDGVVCTERFTEPSEELNKYTFMIVVCFFIKSTA